MRQNLRKLNLLFRFTKLNPEMFYSITCDSEIHLQGHFNPNIVKIAANLKFDMSICTVNGYVKYYRNGIEITLTE